jgi:hypothetical protein
MCNPTDCVNYQDNSLPTFRLAQDSVLSLNKTFRTTASDLGQG